MSARPVLLALGDDGSVAAVRYAVGLARRLGAPLHLVLAVPAGGARTRTSHELELHSALGLARDRAGGEVAVTGALAEGDDVVSCVVATVSACHAELLVLGRTGGERSGRFASGSVLAVVAARSPAPVVVVPAGWRPATAPDPVVVVGVQDVVEAPALLDAGASAAHGLGARLVVVHASRTGENHAVVGIDVRDDLRTFGRTEHASLERCLTALRNRWPGVDVGLDVDRGPVESTLLTAGTGAELVVVGRHHHRLPVGSHLGPVTRALLDHCTAPLLLTDPVTVRTVPTAATTTATTIATPDLEHC